MESVIYTGSVETILPRCFEDDSFDACFCDPPYGLKFMGKSWDHGVPGVEVWKEVLRVLKPGARLLAFGGTRTFHRLTCAIEDAGFEIRDCLMWIYGSGFPKSYDISKGIDKLNGDERLISGYRDLPWKGVGCNADSNIKVGVRLNNSGYQVVPVTAPASDTSASWQGYGTALKPSYEPIICAMKPLAPGMTYAQNALAYGVAGLNIDGSRIAGAVPITTQGASSRIYGGGSGFAPDGLQQSEPHDGGRWPANLILDEESAAMLDMGQKGFRVGDSGGISRFFYCAKVSTFERNMGLNSLDCKHPTLKPIKLTEYLARLILPPARSNPDSPRSLLVPFSGAGSEMIGAGLAGWDLVTGVEQDEGAVEWAKVRIEGAQTRDELPARARNSSKQHVTGKLDLDLESI